MSVLFMIYYSFVLFQPSESVNILVPAVEELQSQPKENNLDFNKQNLKNLENVLLKNIPETSSLLKVKLEQLFIIY